MKEKSLIKEVRCNYYNSIMHFINNLLNLSNKLKEYENIYRDIILRKELNNMNDWIQKQKLQYDVYENINSNLFEGIIFPFNLDQNDQVKKIIYNLIIFRNF